MNVRCKVADLIGMLGILLLRLANRIHPPPQLTRLWWAETEDGWNECNLPTMPCPPPVPADDEDGDHITNRRIEIRPPAMPKSERRVILVDGKPASVTPPPGSWWGRGGSG